MLPEQKYLLELSVQRYGLLDEGQGLSTTTVLVTVALRTGGPESLKSKHATMDRVFSATFSTPQSW